MHFSLGLPGQIYPQRRNAGGRYVGLDARSTMDLDAAVNGANVNVEDVENMMAEIIAVLIDDGVAFQVKSISEIMDEQNIPASGSQ